MQKIASADGRNHCYSYNNNVFAHINDLDEIINALVDQSRKTRQMLPILEQL